MEVCTERLRRLWGRLTRVRRPTFLSYDRPIFDQVYEFLDCCSWGTGIMMGAGVFMYLPIIIKYIAGPSTVLSYIVGGAIVYTCVFSFAELSSRFPYCGGTYVYNYAIFGEFVASIMGVSLLLHHLIIAADICISLSEHIDYFIFKRSLEDFEEREFAYSDEDTSVVFASYPRFFASLLIVLVSVILTTKSKYNNFIGSCANYISFFMVLLIVFVGAFYLDFDNWFNVEGGFVPYGYSSIFRGATVILSTYLGFVELPCVSDEAINPAKDIGRAAHSSFFFVLCIYISVSTVVSLLVPYDSVKTNFAMANIFIDIGVDWMKYSVEIGSIAALFSTAMCVLQAASRLAFCMGKDGVILPCFGAIQQRNKIPFNSVMWCGFTGAVIPLFFDPTYLIRLAETGYMFNCIMANLGVLVLRYCYNPQQQEQEEESETPITETIRVDERDGEDQKERECCVSSPVSTQTETRAKLCIGLSLVWLAGLILCTNYVERLIHSWLGEAGYVCLTVSFVCLMVFQVFLLSLLPQNPNDCEYPTPWVPWLPMISIYLTAFVIFQESPAFFWETEAVFLGVSLLVYCSYSAWHTVYEEDSTDEEKEILTITPHTRYHSTSEQPPATQQPGTFVSDRGGRHPTVRQATGRNSSNVGDSSDSFYSTFERSSGNERSTNLLDQKFPWVNYHSNLDQDSRVNQERSTRESINHGQEDEEGTEIHDSDGTKNYNSS